MCFPNNRLRQRVCRALLYRCRQRQQFSLANTACRVNRCDARFTHGQSTRFIKRDLRDSSQLFQRGPAFVLIRYYAVRSPEGEYLGVLECTEEISGLRALEGQKTLMS